MKKIIFLLLVTVVFFSAYCAAGQYVGYDKYEEYGVSVPTSAGGGTYWDTPMTDRWNTAMTALWNTSMDTEIP